MAKNPEKYIMKGNIHCHHETNNLRAVGIIRKVFNVAFITDGKLIQIRRRNYIMQL